MTVPGKKLKLLITGSNGLLGQKVAAQAGQHFWTVGADLDRQCLCPVDEYLVLDITQHQAVLDAVERIAPWGVINTAALTNVDACEKERDLAWSVNVEGVSNLQEACQRVGAILVQISSDYIFDGQAGPYDEDAAPRPVDFYGLTKLESEKILIASRTPWVVVRTNVLYGWARGVRANFVLWVYSHLVASKYIRAAIDQYGNPTLADHLAKGVLLLLAGNHRGVFHIAGADYISRWTFALMIARAFGLNQELIAPALSSQLSQRAHRPRWGGLKVEHTVRKLGLPMIGVQAGLEKVKEQLSQCEREAR